MIEQSTIVSTNRFAFPCILILAIILRLLTVVAVVSSAPPADAPLYHQTGIEIAGVLATGAPINNLQSYDEMFHGTRTYALITGVFYYLFGHSYVLMTAFNSLLGFLGSVLFYRVVLSHYPNASFLSRFMIFFDPTILLWTSIHGKDPYTFFLLAVVFWSLSRVVAGAHGYLVLYAAAVAGLATIRVHVALIAAVAASFCMLRFRRTILSRAMERLLALSLMLFIVLAARFVTLYIREFSYQFIVSQIGETLSSLAYGGSAISVPEISSISDLLAYWPRGMLGVLFRPFPWDSGVFSLHVAAAAQAVISCAVLVIGWRLWKRRLHPDPLRSFIVYYGALFVALFALIVGNLGTLVREKTQLVPFIWCLLAATGSVVKVRKSHLAYGPQRRIAKVIRASDLAAPS